MDRATLKEAAKSQIKGNIGILFVLSLIIGLVGGLVGCIPVIGSIASAVVLVPAFSLAMIYIYLNLIDGVKPEVKDLFAHIQEFWGAFKVTFLVSLFTGLWSMLFFIPGIVKACSYSQAMYILAENPGIGAREAINRSKAMMEGHKMEYFILGLSFIGWAIVGSFTFGILYIWLIPYMNATFANFYANLKNTEPVAGF